MIESGAQLVGVALSDLFLAFGSYFRVPLVELLTGMNCIRHRLLVEFIILVTHQAGRSLIGMGFFLFGGFFFNTSSVGKLKIRGEH